MSMIPGGVFLPKMSAPSTPPMVEKAAPRKSRKMKLTIADPTRMPGVVERVAYSRNSGGMLFIVSSETLEDALFDWAPSAD